MREEIDRGGDRGPRGDVEIAQLRVERGTKMWGEIEDT